MVPANLAAGTYDISVKLFYSGDEDDGVHADEKDVSLTVKACGPIVDNTPVDNLPDNVQVSDDGQVEITIPDSILEEFGIVETVDEPGFSDSTGFVVLLTVLITLAVGGIVGLIVVLVKRV